MDKTIFVSKDELDLECIYLLGFSSKPNTNNPIGEFGTGLKYSIAVLVRENIKINIYIGETLYTVSTVKKVIRRKETEIINIFNTSTGEKITLPFTTAYGKNWTLENVYRELYSNTLDENGFITNNLNDIEEEYKTRILIESDIFSKIHKNRYENILLPENLESIEKYDQIEIYNKESNKIYYNGIAIYNSPTLKYTYNILKKVNLTEDRTLLSIQQFSELVFKFLFNRIDLLKEISSIKNENFYENTIDIWDHSVKFLIHHLSEEKKKDVFEVCLQYRINKNVLKIILEDAKYNLTIKETKISDEYENIIKNSVEFISKNFIDIYNYPIKVAVMDDKIMGRVYDGKIFLNECIFKTETEDYITATILEEYLHLSRGFSDCSYPFQNYLFDLIIKLMRLTHKVK